MAKRRIQAQLRPSHPATYNRLHSASFHKLVGGLFYGQKEFHELANVKKKRYSTHLGTKSNAIFSGASISALFTCVYIETALIQKSNNIIVN